MTTTITADQMRAFADATHAIRASHGQAPAHHARITELESQLAQRFDAADVATAAAQGFRDGAASLTAQAVVQDDLITIRKPTTSAEMLWLLKLARLVISDVGKTLEETFAPAQPAAEASRFGSPELPAYTEDQLAAWQEGASARITTAAPQPSPTAQSADSVLEDAMRYRWLCCKFGETRFPCALEDWLEHGYIADGKPSIDAAIDEAIKRGDQHGTE